MDNPHSTSVDKPQQANSQPTETAHHASGRQSPDGLKIFMFVVLALVVGMVGYMIALLASLQG